MPETPEQLYERVSRSLRMPPVEEWDSFPFEGDMRPRALRPPVAKETKRTGAGGVDCFNCSAPDTDYLWVYIRYLRQKLEKDPSNPKYIVSVPGFGYRLETPKDG